MQPQLLKTSGLNSHFDVEHVSFEHYILHMQDIIARARLDLNGPHAAKIIQTNSPFQWSLNHQHHKITKGVLLIHGLFDSPFRMWELGRYFMRKGFLVRGILLPGHGTVPGDLLNISYLEWIKAVRYGVKSLHADVDQVYLCGFSLGGLLSIHETLMQNTAHALILFAPALKPHTKLAPLAKWHKLLSRLFPSLAWYKRCPPLCYTKYDSLACNAAGQIYELMKKTMSLLQQKNIPVPVFVTASTDDETIDTQFTLNYFLQQKNPANQFLLYTAQTNLSIADQKIKIHNSYYPERKILNFSHHCLLTPPSNFQYGEQGEYHDFLHYDNCTPPAGEVFKGAATQENLAKHVIERLGFNPDFDGMLKEIDIFLDKVSG